MSSRKSKPVKDRRSRPFRETRKHHHIETAEDYTELISELIKSEGEARIGTVASCLGISHVTALRTIKRLKRDGYVDTAPHRPIILTEKGRALARLSKERHALVVQFFKAIGVPDTVAEIDAEGAEHHISDQTLACIRNFLRKS